MESASAEDPRVSIVIPVYNRSDLLGPCFAALRAQTLNELEIIVVDDKSADETRAFLRHYALLDPRIRLLDNLGPKGANSCRNIGLQSSRGDYVIFLDSDDVLAPFCLERRLADIEAAPHLDFIAYPCLVFDRHPFDRLLIWNVNNEHPLLDRFLSHDAPFQTSGPIWRRSSIIETLRWDEAMPGWQDWLFHVEALITGLKGEFRTRIDYFWSAPKVESITKTSHDHRGRVGRMRGILRLVEKAPPALAPNILSSIISLGVRMVRHRPLRTALAVYKALKGRPAAFDAAMFVALYRWRLPVITLVRGHFRKRVYRKYPLVHSILNHSNTYKLVASDAQLQELRSLTDEHRNLSKRRR